MISVGSTMEFIDFMEICDSQNETINNMAEYVCVRNGYGSVTNIYTTKCVSPLLCQYRIHMSYRFLLGTFSLTTSFQVSYHNILCGYISFHTTEWRIKMTSIHVTAHIILFRFQTWMYTDLSLHPVWLRLECVCVSSVSI